MHEDVEAFDRPRRWQGMLAIGIATGGFMRCRVVGGVGRERTVQEVAAGYPVAVAEQGLPRAGPVPAPAGAAGERTEPASPAEGGK